MNANNIKYNKLRKYNMLILYAFTTAMIDNMVMRIFKRLLYRLPRSMLVARELIALYISTRQRSELPENTYYSFSIENLLTPRTEGRKEPSGIMTFSSSLFAPSLFSG